MNDLQLKNSINVPQSNKLQNKDQLPDPLQQTNSENYPQSRRIEKILNHQTLNNLIIKNNLTLIVNNMITIITFHQEQIKHHITFAINQEKIIEFLFQNLKFHDQSSLAKLNKAKTVSC